MSSDGRCGVVGCDQLAITKLEGQARCRKHFIRGAYNLLDDASEKLQNASFHGPAAEPAVRRLDDCMQAATLLAIATEKAENLERAQLMDILLWAGELCRRIRRGPRRGIANAIVLRSDAPGHTWEEETQTSVLSRHGASVSCHHQVAQGDILRVRRKDMNSEAPARIAWVRHAADQTFEIGLEFLDAENFWRLDWSEGATRAKP